ncbi:MAG: TetR/AcrR family transcriptional regulator [Anaerocolumna sp.]
MAIKKNNNLQNRMTKEIIFTALMILMKKKNFKEITITEVCNRAGVSRMAFYRNYNIMEDIITDYLDELFEGYSKQILSCEDRYNKESVRLFFAYFREHNRLITNLISSNLNYLILERCIEFFYTLSRNIVCSDSHLPLKEKYIIEFAAGGLYKVLIEWAKNGMKESDGDMADICYCLMEH